MRTGKLLVMTAILGLAAAGAATADDVVHFRNGAHLPVLSHDVKDGMVHVTLASDAQMAFPLNLVDRIESGGKAVFPSPTANRAVEGPPEGTVSLDNPPKSAQRYAAAPGSSRRSGGGTANRAAPDPDDDTFVGMTGYAPSSSSEARTDTPSDAVGRPFADSPDPKRRQITVVGDQTLVPRGGDTVGRTTLINADETQRGRKFTPITIRPKAVPSAPPPPPDAEAAPPASDSSGASSTEGSSASDSSGS